MQLDLNSITNGHREANWTLETWSNYLRCVDDIVDKGQWAPARLVLAFALGCRFYTTDFYRRNISMLQAPVLTATSFWETSSLWEKSPLLWKRRWADVLRHGDIGLLTMMAMICRGWADAQEISRAGLAAAYVDHADRHGVE